MPALREGYAHFRATQKDAARSRDFEQFIAEHKEWLIYYDNYGEKNYKASSTTDFIHFEDVSSKISLPEGHKHGTITTISEEILKGLKEKK